MDRDPRNLHRVALRGNVPSAGADGARTACAAGWGGSSCGAFQTGRFLGIRWWACVLGLAVSMMASLPAGQPLPGGEEVRLEYVPSPVLNPLKGFIPYLRREESFPHSLEWDYTRLSDVMKGPDQFDWEPFESKLEAAASRGHQFVARFYMEWPGRETGVPRYLVDAGLVMRRWTNSNTQPLPPAVDFTPDYEDPRLREALTRFIHALGRRYDGDPRLGFVGLGLLGTWGEWHNYPNDSWFASKSVQRAVLDAYGAAFRKTRLLARYPAGDGDSRYEPNGQRAVGYHDDSFAWATVHTGRPEEAWFFETRLRSANALGKWRTHPVGGEVRPELWSCLFEEPSCAPVGQDVDRCLEVTHVSWLCNEGAFRKDMSGPERQRTLRAAQRMGYELHVSSAAFSLAGGRARVSLTVTNSGIAPFYYDWPVELAVRDGRGGTRATWVPDWNLSALQPGESATVWRHEADLKVPSGETCMLLLRVPNPMPQGLPLRFANATQDRTSPGWLTLGEWRP